MDIILLCIGAASLGGFAKSFLSHGGRIIFPEFKNNYLVLGVFGDMILGGIVGFLVSDQLVYSFFGLSSPNVAFSLVSGILYNTILETIITRLGLKKGNGGNSALERSDCGENTKLHGFTPLIAFYGI